MTATGALPAWGFSGCATRSAWPAPRVAALVMFSTASLARATRALPPWLIVGTYVVGLGELVNVTIRTPSVYVFPAWIAVVSVVLLARRPAQGFEIAEITEAADPAV